ncbi:MAG TPA: RsmE family RNA methyltransferase [Patescibacteria group bacterium]|nr:RsmE family RNA methyltransferase [Patescibacteria group bacterium]
MKIHRFYIKPDTELKHDIWIHDIALLNQWQKVLRFRSGQELVLFDGAEHDRLYRIEEFNANEAHLKYVTDFERKLPPKDIYLLWSLLKKDKNDWVLQKCTELGVSHFLPLLADRSEKTGFNLERAKKIIIEAAEQCGRSDIPNVREPVNVASALQELQYKLPLFVCEQDEKESTTETPDKIGVLIGPEGGWSDAERELFRENNLKYISLHDFTLRAETACVAAISKLLQ